MKAREFAEKVDYEGGVYDAIVGYGLGSKDLDKKKGALYDALVELEKLVPSIRGLITTIEDLLDPYYE